jgi:hypothetical protein
MKQTLISNCKSAKNCMATLKLKAVLNVGVHASPSFKHEDFRLHGRKSTRENDRAAENPSNSAAYDKRFCITKGCLMETGKESNGAPEDTLLHGSRSTVHQTLNPITTSQPVSATSTPVATVKKRKNSGSSDSSEVASQQVIRRNAAQAADTHEIQQLRVTITAVQDANATRFGAIEDQQSAMLLLMRDIRDELKELAGRAGDKEAKGKNVGKF